MINTYTKQKNKINNLYTLVILIKAFIIKTIYQSKKKKIFFRSRKKNNFQFSSIIKTFKSKSQYLF